MTNPTIIRGEALALVSPYSGFNPSDTSEFAAHRFTFVRPDIAPGGVLDSIWAEQGFVVAGSASIVVTLHSLEQITDGRVQALRAQREKILAEAQAKATQIEREIQQLLAIAA